MLKFVIWLWNIRYGIFKDRLHLYVYIPFSLENGLAEFVKIWEFVALLPFNIDVPHRETFQTSRETSGSRQKSL